MAALFQYGRLSIQSLMFCTKSIKRQQHGASTTITSAPATICHIPLTRQRTSPNIMPIQLHTPSSIATMPPTVPNPRPAYFIHHGTSSFGTTSCPGLCISAPIFSASDILDTVTLLRHLPQQLITVKLMTTDSHSPFLLQ